MALASVALPDVAVLTALSDPFGSPALVVVEHCLFLHPHVVDDVEQLRCRVGLDCAVPGLLCWMTKRPLHPASDPYVIESWWSNERAYWRWFRDNAACLSDVVESLRSRNEDVFWSAPQTKMSRLTHYAAAAER